MLAFPLFSPRFGLDRQVLYTVSLLTLVAALAGCASQGKPPPRISLDEPVQAQPLPEPPTPVEVVTVPKVLPLPAPPKPLTEADERQEEHRVGNECLSTFSNRWAPNHSNK